MSSQFVLPIGLDGIGSVSFMPDVTKRILAVGSDGGRVRIFDIQDQGAPVCVYRRRWHKSIRDLAFFESSPNLLVSVSSQSGIKIHDLTSEQRVWMQLKAHAQTRISSLVVTGENQFVTGDEKGVIKLWDKRQQDAGFAIKREDEENPSDPVFSTINELTIGGLGQKWLYAATDDGCLAVYNLRRRRLDMVSDTLGYSARTLSVINSNKQVIVGTEEGVLCQFNIDQYEECAERFPLKPNARSPQNNPAIERIVKITEQLIAVATDDGLIHAVTVAPVTYLGLIGRHLHPGQEVDCGGDCMDLSVNPDATILASGCPATRVVSVWQLGQWTAKIGDDRTVANWKKSKRLKKLDPQKREYLSGLLSPEESHSDASSSDSDIEDEEEFSTSSN